MKAGERSHLLLLAVQLDELHAHALQAQRQALQLHHHLEVRRGEEEYQLVGGEHLAAVEILHHGRQLVAVHVNGLVVRSREGGMPFRCCSS